MDRNMKRTSGLTWSVAAAWRVLWGGYAALAVCVPAGETRTALIDIFLCILPLFVNGALLLNAATPDWRKIAFWMLLAIGCTLWLAGQSILTYVEVYQHRHISVPFIGDVVFFLHVVPDDCGAHAAAAQSASRRAKNALWLCGFLTADLLVGIPLFIYRYPLAIRGCRRRPLRPGFQYRLRAGKSCIRRRRSAYSQ